MKVLRFIICLIATITLSVSLLAAGFFAVSSFPRMTGAVSYVTCDVANSPFNRSQLSSAAAATHEYAFGTHSKNNLYDALAQINDDADTPYAKTTRTRLAAAPDAYVLDERAFSHLDDCYKIAEVAREVLAIVACIAVVFLLLTGLVAKQRNLGRVLIISGCIVIVGFIALAVFAFVDFERLFTLFHSFLFKEGTWTFSENSLLICMLPESFWVAIAGIWALVSALLSIVFILIGSKCVRRARTRAREIQAEAQQSVYYSPYDSIG
ncbi:MAG: DUF1461 domain-containing protein [Eggerthellaceae bacterium]|nr:DUF1461 domain-containing protein [Eggerthellaceae bacterium]